jgi:preprotein translocase SecF subunit
MDFLVNPKINFLKWRYHAIAFSAIFLAIGFGLIAMRGLNFGIDFAGGANVILRFQENPPIGELRSIVSDATIQQYGRADEHSVLLRLPRAKQEGDYAGRVVTMLNERLNGDMQGKIDLNFQGRGVLADLLQSADPDGRGSSPDAAAYYNALAERIIRQRSELGIFTSMDQITGVEGVTPAAARLIRERVALGRFNVLNQETVGPQVGRELQQKAIWAIVLSTLAMGAYIAVRFDLKFGVAGVIILIHDSAMTLAFLAMINAEFEIITVAAFLMVIGYSINDTVVVYDRVRENVKKIRMRESFEAVLNHSINQTLSRTILTGGSVVLVLLSLIFFGGEVIKDFALLLLIGTIAGTYSTLFIVPAVVIVWEKWFGRGGGAGTARRAA